MKECVQIWIERLLAADGLALIGVIQDLEKAFGPTNASDVPNLVGMLNHPDAKVRSGAAVALAAIGPAAAQAIAPLLTALRDADGQVRHDAAVALKQIEPGRLEVIKGLFRLLFDDDDDVSAAAEEGLDKALRNYDGPHAAKFKRRFRIWRD
jgi:HEAT repeat protein